MQRLVVPGRLKSAKHVEDSKAIHRQEEQYQLGVFCSGDGVSIVCRTQDGSHPAFNC